MRGLLGLLIKQRIDQIVAQKLTRGSEALPSALQAIASLTSIYWFNSSRDCSSRIAV